MNLYDFFRVAFLSQDWNDEKATAILGTMVTLWQQGNHIAKDEYFSKILSLVLSILMPVCGHKFFGPTTSGKVIDKALFTEKILGGTFEIRNQKFVFLTVTDMVDQNKQLKPLIQRKSAHKRKLKLDNFGKISTLRSSNHM